MKKQLFSLVMLLALIVFAGTNAMAQDGLAVGTAYWHLPGSTHGVQVAAHTNTSYTWAIRNSTCAGADNGAATDATITAVAGNEHQATIVYGPAATGVYRITCTEATTGDNLCSTVREFYTAIMNIDVIAIASNNLGAQINGAALSTCNDYSTINGSSLVGNDDTDDNTNNLGAWQDAVPAPLFQNTRYVNVSLSVADLSGCTVANAPAASSFAWRFNYTIAGTNYDAPDNFVTMDAAAGATFTDATDPTNQIAVAAGTTSITIPLRSFIRWGTTAADQDQDFTFTVDSGSTVLDGSDADATYDDGTEPAANAANNVSANQHIDASPATPRITIND